jgi:hypothetical protein
MQPRWSLILLIGAGAAAGLAELLKLFTSTRPLEAQEWLGAVAAFGFALTVLLVVRSGPVEVHGRARRLLAADALAAAVLASTLLLFSIWRVTR